MKKIVLSAAVTAAVAAMSMPAMAYKAGDWVVRGGAATVEPNEDSSSVHISGSGYADTGLGVDTDTQVGLTITYMFTDHVAVELLAATPFEHDVVMQGGGLSPTVPEGTKIASVKHLPPTLSLQYFFMDSSSAWQPYAGIGLNYTFILDEDLSDAAVAALSASDLEVDNSMGVSFQLGMDYNINENWLVNAAVWCMDIDTEASFMAGAAPVDAKISIDPWVYMIGVGYKF